MTLTLHPLPVSVAHLRAIDFEIARAMWNGQFHVPCPWYELEEPAKAEMAQRAHVARRHLRVDQNGVQRSRDG
ncbi:MAG: hypothetical protein AAGD13_25520 [Pseudomonadota bacterium]